jgi:fatty-acyl-CoA synthase
MIKRCRGADESLGIGRDASPGDTAIHYVPDGDINRVAERVSFGALKCNIARTASLLRTHGIGKSDVVAVLMPAVPAIYWSNLGAMTAAVAFPVNWMLEPKYILRLLKEADVKAIVALGPTPGFQIWDSLLRIAAELPAGTKVWSVAGPDGTILPDSDLVAAMDRQPDGPIWSDSVTGDDIGAFVHSDGTTGLPKIVKLSHRNMSYRHWSTQLAQQLLFGEVILHDTPMFHVGGLIGRILPPLACGASVLIPTVLGARDKRYIADYWKFVEKYRVTRLSAVPTTLAVLAKSPPVDTDLSSLMPNFITGSTSLPVSVQGRFEQISGVRVLNSYGMTENTASIAIDPRGRPAQGRRVRSPRPLHAGPCGRDRGARCRIHSAARMRSACCRSRDRAGRRAMSIRRMTKTRGPMMVGLSRAILAGSTRMGSSLLQAAPRTSSSAGATTSIRY